MNNIDKILLHITLIEGVGPSAVAQILNCLGHTQLSEIYNLTYNDFIHSFGLHSKTAKPLAEGLRDFKLLEEECTLLEKHDVTWVSCLDKGYPDLLKEIHVPPIGIFVRGQLQYSAHKTIGIVGARKSHSYAKKIIDSIVPVLVNEDWAIMSGGALGADAMAHEATLQAGGITVAVLGSGLLCLYPKSNVRLFERIVDSGGALVTPFPLRMEALPGHFPVRNRIISGLSRGCLVVQAGQRSGATITANCALEQGREVFAVPGSVDDPLSAGCHALLRQGAVLVRNAEDILEEFGYFCKVKVPEPVKQMAIPVKVQPEEEQDDLLVHCRVPISVDELFEKTGLPLTQIYNRLNCLQLEGRVEQNYIGLWQKT